MKTIAYVSSTLARTGPTNQLLNIVRNLDRNAFRPVILTLSPEPADTLIGKFEAAGIELQSLSLSRASGLLLGKRRLAQKLAALRPGVVHSQGLRADTMIAALGGKTPHIVTVRCFPQLDYPMNFGRFRGALMCTAHVGALRKANAVAAVSKAVKENLENEFGFGDVHAVPNGVELTDFGGRDRLDKLALRRRLQLPEKAEIWITTGHLNVRKNPALLIEAWNAVQPRKTDACLILLGDGALMDDCRLLASAGEGIMLPGRVTNVADYLQAADFYVSASRAEGMPNAVLEALACGLPAVLSDIPPHREIVETAPGVGFLFAVDDKEAAIGAMEAMRRADREEMSLAARAAAQAHFSASAMSGRYQELYRQLLSRAGFGSAS